MPRAPMHRHRPSAPRVAEDVHAVERVRVQAREQGARVVRADGNQPQVEGAVPLPNLPEGRARWVGVGVARAVVVDIGREGWDGAVACVAAEPDGFGAA